MPPWSDFEPFIVSGLALGGVYALSGVGLVVLYRATGVLYLAFGAVGAMGALTAWSLGQVGAPGWVTWLTCIAVAAAITLGYGVLFGPALSKRDPLVKAVATIGLTLILYGLMDLLWTTSGGQARSLTLPTDNGGFSIGQIQVNWTQVIPDLVGRPADRAVPRRGRHRGAGADLLEDQCHPGPISSRSSSAAWPWAGCTPCPGSGWWCCTGPPACCTWPSGRSARWAR